jgi:hypothetical protein
MVEALLLVAVGSLIPICVATLVFTLLALRKAQLYVDMVEQRLEHLLEGQVLLLALLREQGRSSEGEHEQRTQQEERVLQESDLLALAVRARRGAEQEIGAPKPDLANVGRDVNAELGRLGRRSPLAGRARTDAPGTRGPTDEKTQQKGRGDEIQPRAANFPDTTSQPAKTSPGGEGARGAVWHPHPDDDVSPTRAAALGDAAVEMFRRHYDKYLENYEGYVKLAARLQQMRDDARVVPGSQAEREWEGRLSRVTDGIQRTTARLDILEEYNPELATDDRVSRRAGIARSHRELERDRREH